MNLRKCSLPAENRRTVLVVGDPKTGKSSLINRWLGSAVLMTGQVTPPINHIIRPGAGAPTYSVLGRRKALSRDQYREILAEDRLFPGAWVEVECCFPCCGKDEVIIESQWQRCDGLPEPNRIVIVLRPYGFSAMTLPRLAEFFAGLASKPSELMVTGLGEEIPKDAIESISHLTGKKLGWRRWQDATW